MGRNSNAAGKGVEAIRQRTHFVGLWLDDGEYRQLMEQCSASGLSASALLRKHITHTEIKPKPPDTYAALLRELSAIGRNINQLAYWANAEKHTSGAEIQEAAHLAREAWRMVKDTL